MPLSSSTCQPRLVSAARHSLQRRRHAQDRARRVLEGAIEAAFQVSAEQLRNPQRGAAPVAFARQCAFYLAHVVLGLSLTDAGCLFGRDRTTASHACRVVEDRRDDPDLDAKLDLIERELVARGLAPRPTHDPWGSAGRRS